MTTLPATAKPPKPPARRRIRLSRGDHEFLPAALEILETPLSPIRSAMIVTICAFAAAALVWSWFGRVDIIATAQGKIQPVGRTKTVQPLETGKVLAIAAQNGARVKAGDVLVTLDAGQARADESTLEADIQSERAEVLRRTTALALASDRALGSVPQIRFPPEVSPSLALREQRVLADDIAQLAGTVGSLDGQAREKRAERNRLTGTIDAQQTLVATLKERVDMRQMLEASRSESRAKVIDALELMQTQQATLASERGQIGEIDASLARLGRDIEKSYAAFAADNAQKLADTERLMDGNAEKLAKARLKTADLTLTSPIDGTVAGSTVTSIGQVVTVGEQVMQIVPSDTKLEIGVLPAQRRCRLRPQGPAGRGEDRVVPVHRLRHDRRRGGARGPRRHPAARRRPARTEPRGGRQGRRPVRGRPALPEPRLPGDAEPRPHGDEFGRGGRAARPRHGGHGRDQDRHAPHPLLPVLAHHAGRYDGDAGAVSRDPPHDGFTPRRCRRGTA